MIYRAWREGRLPDYRPTLADLRAMSAGMGDNERIEFVEPS